MDGYPEIGSRGLYLGKRRPACILGPTLAESESLLSRSVEFAPITRRIVCRAQRPPEWSTSLHAFGFVQRGGGGRLELSD